MKIERSSFDGFRRVTVESSSAPWERWVNLLRFPERRTLFSLTARGIRNSTTKLSIAWQVDFGRYRLDVRSPLPIWLPLTRLTRRG